MSGPFFLAYVDPSDTMWSETFAREDEQVISIDLEHTEGNFASLTIGIVNPHVGLLAPSRKKWAWLSWDSGGSEGIIPLFFGQIVGIPADLHAEVLSVELVARPLDYAEQKAALADTLAVLPFYDPVWLQQNLGDPDTVLEGLSAVWHIDRLTLDVTASDIINGEDGTVEVTASEHFYDDMQVEFSQSPLLNISVTMTVSWDQVSSGEVDLTRPLVDAFRDASSPLPAPYIATMTGDGLLSDWPSPGDNIGGGWTIGPNATVEDATWLAPKYVTVIYSDDSQTQDTDLFSPVDVVALVTSEPAMWNAAYPVGQLKVHFTVAYDADRKRSEIVQFTLAADVQEVVSVQVSSGSDSSETISLSSDYIVQNIDPDGAMPIGDPARPSYFLTDRGQQSFQYGLLLARAHLLARARCCNITIRTTFEKIAAAEMSCRKNVTIFDSRLPGGQATGKVVGYSLQCANGAAFGTLTVACTVGNGGSVSSSAGTPEYVDDYFDDGEVQIWDGQVIDVVAGELTYESFADFVLDDDGVDLLNMTPDNVVESITVTNGLTDQIAAINAGAEAEPPDPSAFLADVPTTVTVNLVPVTGGAFQSTFNPVISALKVPKTIDLAASS